MGTGVDGGLLMLSEPTFAVDVQFSTALRGGRTLVGVLVVAFGYASNARVRCIARA